MPVKPIFELRASEAPKTPIQFKFLCWLFLYASAAFIASLILSFTFATLTAKREVYQVIDSKITEAHDHSKLADEALAALKSMAADAGIQRARAMALLLQTSPELIETDDPQTVVANLGKAARMLGVDEIDITDEKGICLASWPEGAADVNYDYQEGFYTRQFLPILSNPNLEISQEIRPHEGNDDTTLYQFSAVSRRDKPGIVEIGFKATNVQEAYDIAAMSNYISSVVGYDGFLCVFEKADAPNDAEGGPSLVSDGLISGPQFSNINDLKKQPFDKVVICRLRDAVSDKAIPYLVLAQEKDNYLFVGGVTQREIFNSRRLLLFLLVLANFIVFFAVFTLVSKLVKNLIVDSVYAVNRSLEKITNGDLDEKVEVKVSKEFVDLSNGVNATVDSLKQVVNEVKERVSRELLLAKRIQEASLPNVERLFSNRKEFDVYAQNMPMRSVGGDMYDFFYLDNENILFYVADVSGHGVPAALVMMKMMALVKNLSLSGYSLEKIVSLTNSYLAENNDSSFVTGFFCIMNLKTGKMTYVNAGHNSPFIRQTSGTGKFVEFQPEINLILGIVPEAEYVSATIQLEPGDDFILFTDGITEATIPEFEDCFEVKRALKTLNETPRHSTAKEYVQTLFDAVNDFTNNADPSDDETILFFHYAQPTE